MRAVAAFLVFCALSGATYILNDLVDLEQDRRHPVQAPAAARVRGAAAWPSRAAPDSC